MRVIVVGCSRLGVRLAQILADHGHQVAVIDPNPHSLEKLGHDFPGERVLGVGIDFEVLARARAAEAQLFIAVTDRDAANIVSGKIAREKYGIPRVIVRIYDPEVAQTCEERMGLTVFCPTAAGLEFILASLSSDDREEEGGK